MNAATSPADLAIGSFSDTPPWIVDPDACTWKTSLGPIRTATRGEVPRLIRVRRVPPTGRVLSSGLRLGFALARWRYVQRRRHGAGTSESRQALSEGLRRSFEKLGPTYIKLGQIISSGEGLFPDELVREFRKCRDQVPGEPFSSVKATVERELGKPLGDVFASFDETPIAAASIAQVHGATLLTGETVVVKVQRSDVARRVRADLAAMSWIAPHLVGRIPIASLANPPALVELFAETIVEELDFRLEAENMLDIAKVLIETKQRTVIVPRPHPTLVTKRVLVMERLEGFPFDAVDDMHAAGVDTHAVVRAGMVAFLEGAILHGVFHGDLHGGNLLVRADGRVALLDFGITGRLSAARRQAFLRLLVAGSTADPRGQLEALRDLGALPLDTDIEAVVRDLDLDQPSKDPTKMSPDELTKELQNVTKNLLSYGARFPKELMLFVKNMLFLDGAMATMAPDVDLFEEIAHLALHFATQHGGRISSEMGLNINTNGVDTASMKRSVGIDPDEFPTMTYHELQKRRALIQERLHHTKQSASTRPSLRRRSRRDG